MSEMVELVAAAIYAAFEDRPDYARIQINGHFAEDLAIAAIKAMREPTLRVLDINHGNWRAAIDEALK
jgi:hypothetical protein